MPRLWMAAGYASRGLSWSALMGDLIGARLMESCRRRSRVHQDGGQWQALDAAGRELARARTDDPGQRGRRRGVLDASDWSPGCRAWRRCTGRRGHACPPRLDGGPRCIIGGEGYLLPVPAWPAAPVHGAEQALISAEGQQVTLGKAAGLLGTVGPAWNALTPGSLRLGGVAGGFARPPARRGEIGPCPLWMAAGCLARPRPPLMGDLIGARLMGEPSPLERDLAELVTPR